MRKQIATPPPKKKKRFHAQLFITSQMPAKIIRKQIKIQSVLLSKRIKKNRNSVGKREQFSKTCSHAQKVDACTVYLRAMPEF